METNTPKTKKQRPIMPPLTISRKESFDQASTLKTQESSTQTPQETSLNDSTIPSQISIEQELVNKDKLITKLTNKRDAFYVVTLQQNSQIQSLERDIQRANGQIQKLEAFILPSYAGKSSLKRIATSRVCRGPCPKL